MELLDQELEMRALRTLCSRRGSPECAKLLGRLDSDFFKHPHSRRLFRRIRASLKNRGQVPSWASMRVDPALPEASRKHLKIYSDIKPLGPRASGAEYDELFDALNRHRQGRLCWDAFEWGLKELEGEAPDINAVLSEASDALTKARSGAGARPALRLSGGGDDTSGDDFSELLAEGASPAIPTGFKAFDERNGGLLRGSMVVLASPTGGGKSTFGVQLALNMALGLDCCRVCLVPLEMDRRQVLARIYANVAGVAKSRILARTMEPVDRKALRDARKSLAERLAKRDSSIDIDEQGSVSMEDVLNLRSVHGDDAIIVDQLTLLDDASAGSDRQWAAMGEACRVAKLHAVRNDNVVVVLTQLDDVGNVKYSRAVLEHADLAFVWGRDENPQGGSADMEVSTRKVRHQEAVRFRLEVDVATGRMVDSRLAPSQDGGDAPAAKRARVGKRGDGSAPKADGYLDDYLGDN